MLDGDSQRACNADNKSDVTISGHGNGFVATNIVLLDHNGFHVVNDMYTSATVTVFNGRAFAAADAAPSQVSLVCRPA